MIYLDNAATTFVHEGVLDAMLPYLRDMCGNPGAQHAAGRAARYAIDEAREDVAVCLGCKPGEVVFTSGGSEADNQALRTGAAWGRAHGRTRIVSSQIEHPAVLQTLKLLEDEGLTVTLLAPTEKGVVRVEDIEAAMGPDVCALSLMAVNNEVGTVQPFEEAARLAHEAGALFHTDAVQAAGHIALDAAAMGIDMLSVSAHKFHGPKGVGALVCRAQAFGEPLPPARIVLGGGQERGWRAGTENVPGIVGMACALKEAIPDLPRYQGKIAALRDGLQERLASIPGAHILGAQAPRIAGTLGMCFEGVDRQALVAALDRRGVCAAGGSACAAGATRPSPVLAAMGVPPELARGQLRLSLSIDTTAGEVEQAAQAIEDTVARLRALV